MQVHSHSGRIELWTDSRVAMPDGNGMWKDLPLFTYMQFMWDFKYMLRYMLKRQYTTGSIWMAGKICELWIEISLKMGNSPSFRIPQFLSLQASKLTSFRWYNPSRQAAGKKQTCYRFITFRSFHSLQRIILLFL